MLNDVNTPRFGIWLTGFRFHAAAPWMPRLLAAGCAAAVSLSAIAVGFIADYVSDFSRS